MTLAIREDNNGDIVLHQRAATPAQDYASNAITRLTDWAQEARAAASIAASLVKTSFVPEAFRGKAEEATAAILTGFEMGLSPMAALRAIYVIKGTPGMYAKTMRAIVQSKGHEIWVESANSTRVVVKGRRKGADQVETSAWDMERVKKAQLNNNSQYGKNPQNMLTARATAEVCWLIAADALHGISASVEELGEDPEGFYSAGEDGVVETTEAPKRTAKRKPVEKAVGAEPDTETQLPSPTAKGDRFYREPVSTPPADAAEDAGPNPDPAVVDTEREPMTKAQQGKMHALFNEVDVTDRPARMQYVNEVLAEEYGPDRQVSSSSELSKDETGKVIDRLQRWADDIQPTAAEVADVVGDVR